MREGVGRFVRTGAALLLLGTVVALLIATTGSARLERADFVFNNGNEVRTLDPATVTGIAEGRVIRALFEGLTVMDPETLGPLPGMAERWEVSEDKRTYTFHLRRDACWTSPGGDPARFAERGEPVTAHDFVHSWRRLLEPATAAEYAYQLWCVEGAKQYSLLPDDAYYAKAQYFRILENGRVRVGADGINARRSAPDLEVRITDSSGEPIFHIGEERLVIPPFVRGATANPTPPRTLGELAEDPYEQGWLYEGELVEDELEKAVAERELFRGSEDLRRLFWPAVGIRALNDHTLVVQLERPTPYFLDLTASFFTYPVHVPSLEAAKERWPHSWQVEWVRPENLVTNGPFRIVERRINDRIRLVRNPVYWDVENVALRTVDALAVAHQVTSLNLYLTGEVDWIDSVPTDLVPRLMEREDFQPSPHLGTYFYRVNVDRPPLDDARVRRALALAIDRRAICAKVLKAGQIPSWGFVPHGMPGYRRHALEHGDPGEGMRDYEGSFGEDCARALELLAEAGYGENGEPFPSIAIHYNTSETHRDIAEVVVDGWKQRLDIDVRLSNQEWKVYMDDQRNLRYDLSRSSWMGDFVDPTNFLDVFRTGSANNRTGWSHARYDALLDEASREPDEARRAELLSEAEGILTTELPILPIYTYVTQNLVDPRLEGFGENVLDIHFLKFLRWREEGGR